MRSKNRVLCAAAGSLATKRSETDKPAKSIHYIITNYLRNVNKPGRRLGGLIIVIYLTSSCVILAFFGMSGPV
jgi:hypothetical protein